MASHYPGSEQTRLALDTFIKLQRASNTLVGTLQRSLRESGLTEPQFAVLEMLFHIGPQQQNFMAKKMLCTGANTTFVIDRLESAGLVTRLVSPEDRRCTMVSLTDKGRETISRIFPEHASLISGFMARLSSEEQAELGRLCKKLGLGSAASCPSDQDEPKPQSQIQSIESTNNEKP